jgi:hypothetical protein
MTNELNRERARQLAEEAIQKIPTAKPEDIRNLISYILHLINNFGLIDLIEKLSNAFPEQAELGTLSETPPSTTINQEKKQSR